MALNGHPPSPAYSKPNGLAPPVKPLEDWLKLYGRDEHDAWEHRNPTQRLSYEDWKASDHVCGPYLYYATLHFWHDSELSDAEDAEIVEVAAARSRGARALALSRREPKKTVTKNGTGATRAAGSATPSDFAIREEPASSAKRKRKSRKKYLSEEIVASDEDPEDIEAPSFVSENATPSAPPAAINGKGKSSSRKPRRKPISDKMISPEDEEDDPMLLDRSATEINSPLPLRSAPNAQHTQRTSGAGKWRECDRLDKSTKKLIVSLPFHSWDAVSTESKSRETDFFNKTAATGSSSGPRGKENAAAANANEEPDVDNTKHDDANASYDPNSRRELRTRCPTRKVSCFPDAQLPEDADTLPTEVDVSRSTSPASIIKQAPTNPYHRSHDEALIEAMEREAEPLDASEDDMEDSKQHKGKGGGVRKSGATEDKDPKSPTKPKADTPSAPMMQNAVQQVPRKRGRPRKHPLPDAAAAAPTVPKRPRGRPRKSALSTEVQREDPSDEESPRKKRDMKGDVKHDAKSHAPVNAASKTADTPAAPAAPTASVNQKTPTPNKASEIQKAPTAQKTSSQPYPRILFLTSQKTAASKKEAEAQKTLASSAALATPALGTPTARKRGRPRKSDPTAPSNIRAMAAQLKADTEGSRASKTASPKRSPNKPMPTATDNRDKCESKESGPTGDSAMDIDEPAPRNTKSASAEVTQDGGSKKTGDADKVNGGSGKADRVDENEPEKINDKAVEAENSTNKAAGEEVKEGFTAINRFPFPPRDLGGSGVVDQDRVSASSCGSEWTSVDDTDYDGDDFQGRRP